MGSKRFPNKILKKIDHRSVLKYLLDELLKNFKKEEIIVATTKIKKDDKICKFLMKSNFNFFRGSENNLLNRYLECAKKYRVSNIIRITSDCPLVDSRIINRMYKIFSKSNIEYYSNTCPPKMSTFPDGSDIEIFSFKSLKKLNKITKSKKDKEHLYGFWKYKKKFKIKTFKRKKDISMFKYSLDYASDLLLLRNIVKKLKEKNYTHSPNNIVRIIKNDKKLLRISKFNYLAYLKNKNY